MKALILGFAGGIMIAASFFGLLIPSIDGSKSSTFYSFFAFVPPLVGFLLGALLFYGLDKVVSHFHKLQNVEEGLKNVALSKNFRLFLAVTLHNIPEGVAVVFILLF